MLLGRVVRAILVSAYGTHSLMHRPRNAAVLALLAALGLICTNVRHAQAAPSSPALRDTCGHTLLPPAGYFKRHFDYGFLKKFFAHWIPFTHTPRVKMQFFLYKRDFAECGREIVTDDDASLHMSGFEALHPTRIIIHGWMSQSKGSFNRAVKKAYLSLTNRTAAAAVQPLDPATAADSDTTDNITTTTTTPIPTTTTLPPPHHNNNNIPSDNVSHNDDFNVIVVDWSLTSSNLNYFGVVELIEDLGLLLADFVRFLHIRRGLHYDDVYLIGHSLGAQIAGSAGKRAQPFRYNTIFALDPAGPKFRSLSDDNRLDPSDATYVESIQTSSSLGFEEPMGHATFYPNFGRDQKKCYFYGCSHKRAYNYFAESITSTRGFWGTLCRRGSKEKDEWELSTSGAEFRMGGEPSAPKRGTFYVKTAAEPPYALGRKHTTAVDVELEHLEEWL